MTKAEEKKLLKAFRMSKISEKLKVKNSIIYPKAVIYSTVEDILRTRSERILKILNYK